MNIIAKSCAFAFFVLFGFLLSAQTTPSNSEKLEAPNKQARAEQRGNGWDKELNLTKEQSEQFSKIDKDYREKSKATQKGKHEDMKKMREERKAAHKALLNEEQALKYDEVLAKRHEQKMARKAAHKAEKKVEKKSGKPKTIQPGNRQE